LKPIDIVVLKKLSEVVNVVPVIAKSDSLTIEERQAFKQRVIATLAKGADFVILMIPLFYFFLTDQGRIDLSQYQVISL
jgi:septin family protein